MLAESFDRRPIGQLRQHTPGHQRAREIVSDRLLPRQIDRALSGHYGRKFLVGQTALLADEHMGVKLVSRLEMRTGDEDGDLPHRLRQRGLVGERPDKVPARLAEGSSCNHGFHGPSKVPSSRMATNPLNLLAMPSRMSS